MPFTQSVAIGHGASTTTHPTNVPPSAMQAYSCLAGNNSYQSLAKARGKAPSGTSSKVLVQVSKIGYQPPRSRKQTAKVLAPRQYSFTNGNRSKSNNAKHVKMSSYKQFTKNLNRTSNFNNQQRNELENALFSTQKPPIATNKEHHSKASKDRYVNEIRKVAFNKSSKNLRMMF